MDPGPAPGIAWHRIRGGVLLSFPRQCVGLIGILVHTCCLRLCRALFPRRTPSEPVILSGIPAPPHRKPFISGWQCPHGRIGSHPLFHFLLGTGDESLESALVLTLHKVTVDTHKPRTAS